MMDTQHFFEISLQWELRGKTTLARHQNLRKSWNTANDIFVLYLNNYLFLQHEELSQKFKLHLFYYICPSVLHAGIIHKV